MPRETEPSLNERSFILQALRENIRLDGRAFDAFRDMELSFGDQYGVADVRLGETRYHLLFYYGTSESRYTKVAKSQSHSPYLSNRNATVPRPQIRRHLHRHDRALPHGLPSL